MAAAAILIVGDIGGTNARMIAYTVPDDAARDTAVAASDVREIFKVSMCTFEYPSLAPLLNAFLKKPSIEPSAISRVVLAMCGPVWNGGRSNDPNNVFYQPVTDSTIPAGSDTSPSLPTKGSGDSAGLRWAVHHAGDIEAEVALRDGAIRFLNDFEAIGHCIAALKDDKASPACKPTPPRPVYLPSTGAHTGTSQAPVGVVGAGTGLGACLVTHSGGTYSVWPSEGGMTDTICPRNDSEFRLLQMLRRKYGEVVEVEAIVSGPGIVNAFEFLTAECSDVDACQAILAARPDERAALITAAAARGNPLCKQAVDIFLDFYGRTLAVHALTWLCYGGLYVAGGVLPKLLGHATDALMSESGTGLFLPAENPLLRSYLHQGPRIRDTIVSVPVFLLDDGDSGIKGALYVAMQH